MSIVFRSFQILLIAVAVIIFSNTMFSQGIEMHVTHADIDQLSVGDIDFENFGSSHWFFTIDLQSSIPRSVKLFVDIDVNLANESFPGAVSFTTEPFLIPRTFTNLDIGKNGDIKIAPGTFEYSEDAKKKIRDAALSTGKLPSGTYTFNLRVEDAIIPTEQASDQIILVLRNISRLELLNPQNQTEVQTPFPLFQWLYEGTRVELAIYEKLPQHQSNEEALNGTPHLVIRSGDPFLPEGVRTFQYPTGGVRALEAGKTYVWRVRSISSGSGGSDEGVNSEVWSFSVANSSGNEQNLQANSAGQVITQEEFTDLVTDIPGINVDALKEILQQYQMTGEIYINGQRISFLELKKLLDELLASPDRIIQLELVDVP